MTANRDDPTCRKKQRYPDEHTARAAAQFILQRLSKEQALMYVYQCPHCRGWHLTSASFRGRNFPVSRDELYHEPAT